MQEWYLGWEKVSCLERCPQFRRVLIDRVPLYYVHIRISVCVCVCVCVCVYTAQVGHCQACEGHNEGRAVCNISHRHIQHTGRVGSPLHTISCHISQHCTQTSTVSQISIVQLPTLIGNLCMYIYHPKHHTIHPHFVRHFSAVHVQYVLNLVNVSYLQPPYKFFIISTCKR